MTLPTIIFVPGFWEGPAPFEDVSSLLQQQGYSAQTAILPSTGTTSPGNPTMIDDISAIRSIVEKAVTEDQEVVMVMHSAGGFLGSSAIKGLTAKARSASGLKGGVSKIVFLTAGIGPEGFEHAQLPFFKYHDDGGMTCVEPEKLLFSDLDEAKTANWMKELKTQPAAGWDGTINYCGWREVPSVYLICEGDAVLPAALQAQFAGLAGSIIERCEAGHMVMLSMPEKVVDVVMKVALGA